LARDAYFGAGDISVLPQTGRALDLSRDGVLIRTARPLPEGTAIEVELRPEKWVPGQALILTRGRVARIVDCGNGDYDMGVQLHVASGPGSTVANAGGAPSSVRDLGSLMANLRPRDAAYAHTHRLGWGGGYSKHVRFKEAKPKTPWWNSWRWPLLFLAAGLLSLLLWPALLTDLRPDGNLDRYQANPAPAIEYREPPETIEAPVGTTPNSGASGNTAEPLQPLRATEPPVTNRPWPEPNRTIMRDADYPRAEQTSRDEPAYSFYGRSQGAPPNPYADSSGVVLEVDRATHRMRLFMDGALQHSFAIGLGRDGTTPAGEFTVGNKLTDPDWYNGGDVVPAGAPENPLGRRWLGLARDGALSPYGIHATADLNSVGRNDSRGCIRVAPDDAETIFRLCPIGARVVIR
jgi:lipoprotein-anchoring transpeptidase ErfK/SrfK